MSNYQNDQAAGLRRIMAAPKPRVVSVICASLSSNQAQMMTNLAASLMDKGSDVLLVHASQESSEVKYGVDQSPSLLEVVSNQATLNEAITTTPSGFSAAKLMHKHALQQPLNAQADAQLSHAFNHLAQQYEMILVDATLNTQHLLPLSTLNASDIIIQLTRKPESITQAYTMIKQICAELGRRSFGIIVEDATEAQAQVVFNNIAQVAKRFMRIELEFFGAIPSDEHLGRASKLGRSVIDAFPLASASTALKQIAQRLAFTQAYRANPHQLSYR